MRVKYGILSYMSGTKSDSATEVMGKVYMDF